MAFVNRVPNLELVLYKAQQILAHDKDFIRTLTERKKENKHVYMDFTVETFTQAWGSTTTGFDITESGEPTIGGSAITEEYTVVIHERTTDCYLIFFGEQPCYKIVNANEQFFEDLKNRDMASLSKAKTRY